MLANKHEAIYEENADPIQKMLEGSDESVRPYALYLGNWMADMSQLYDPGVADFLLGLLSKAGKTLLPMIDGVDTIVKKLGKVDKVVKLLLVVLPILGGRAVCKPLATANDRLREAVHKLGSELKGLRKGLKRLKGLKLRPDAVSETMGLLHALVMANCVLKFGMNPSKRNRAIAPAEVVRLFHAHFGSYKPYQHLDRFLDPAAVEGLSPKQIEENYAQYVAKSAQRSDHGMKDYLRDGVRIAAIQLNTFSKASPTKLTNDDLVKLGFSLHAIEDFFAHSNFIERLVITNIGDNAGPDPWTATFAEAELPKLVTSNIGLESMKGNDLKIPYIKYLDRTARAAGPIEPNLVTGYFTRADAKHSLFHLAADHILSLFEEQLEDGAKPSALDFFERLFVDKPLDELERIQESGANLLQLVRSEGIWISEAIVRDVLSGPYKNPPQALVDALVTLANAYIAVLAAVSIGKDLKETIDSVKAIIEVVRTIISIVKLLASAGRSLTAIVELLSPWLESLAKYLLDEDVKLYLAGKTDQLLVDLKRAMLDEPAIGSHSAIAKDDRLGKGGLYAKVQSFAVAVDALVLKHIVRDPGKPEPEAGSDEAKPIQWDETLLALLTDPFKIYGTPKPEPVNVRFVDAVTVKAPLLDSVVRTGFAASGYETIASYLQALLALNPTISLEGGRYLFHRGPPEQDIFIPLLNPRAAKGWLCLPEVVVDYDWRQELYLDGKGSLVGSLVRGSSESLEIAIKQGQALRKQTFDAFEKVTYQIYPAAKTIGIIWGYGT